MNKSFIITCFLSGFSAQAFASAFTEEEEVLIPLAQSLGFESLRDYRNALAIEQNIVEQHMDPDHVAHFFSASDSQDNDAAIAHLLSKEEEEGEAYLKACVDTGIVLDPEDQAAHAAIQNVWSKVISHELDVHSMTANVARPYYPQIKALEKKYFGYTSHLSPEDINHGINWFKERWQNLSDYYSGPQYATLKASVEKFITANEKLWTNLSSDDVDSETGHSLRDVFAHTYMATLARDHMRKDPVEYFSLLCQILADNIETSGGCHSGITGRLVHFYGKILLDSIES